MTGGLAIIRKVCRHAREILPLMFTAPIHATTIMQNKRLKPDKLRKLQCKKLTATIKHAYDNVPYYHSLFRKKRIMPRDIKTIEDLQKIPITKKDDIRNLPTERLVARNIDINRCSRRRTSGTTGSPFFPYRTISSELIEQLNLIRWQIECGIKLTDKIATIGLDYLLNPIQKSRVVSISPHDDPQKQIKQIAGWKPKVIFAYPSSLRLLAKEINERDIRKIDTRLIFTSGESLDIHTRKLVQDVFDAEVFDGYGAMEVGGVCTECVKHSGYHIWADSVLVEIVRDGGNVSPGHEGKITVTNLTNYAMPFIRYNLEDLGTIIKDTPSCGSYLPLMKISGGREGDLIELPGGKLIPSWELVNFFTSISGIKQFQIIQEKTDWFKIRVVKNEEYTNATAKEIEDTLLSRIKRRLNREKVNVTIDVLTVHHIPREKSGKYKPVITKILRED